jgi:DNA processing protein
VVVSGLALGCDTQGHRGCLEESGTAVAVLAHGLDEVHPNANRPLAEEIVAKGGCLVSEYPIGTEPKPNQFITRDRIQSGLSDAVVVIETGVNGGSMHTVRFAKRQRRLVMCIVPTHDPGAEEQTSGNRLLLDKHQATGFATTDDLIQLIGKWPTGQEQLSL